MAQRTPRLPTSDEALTSASTSHKSADSSPRKSFESTDLTKAQRIARVSLAVDDGETLVILGPSGAGKTSFLRIVAGLEMPDGGSVRLDGRDVTHVPAQHRRVALVSQDDSLFPHMTIYENLAFAMRVRRRSARAIDDRVRGFAQALEIEPYLSARPARLSGGERQRAAFARAILSDPRLLLLDEPFAHLDPQLRQHVRAQFRDVRRKFSGAVIHVTHDHAEAVSFGDRLAIMIDGEIVQCADPQAVYDFPANVRVARFFGSPPMNLIDNDEEITGIRPEHVQLNEHAALRGRVEEYESVGSDALVRVRTERGVIVARVTTTLLPRNGDRVGVELPPQFLRRFDARTGQLLA